MLKYIVKRILQAIPQLFVITVLCFVLMQLAPYDAIDAIVTPDMTPQEIEMKKEAAGLNDPVYVQYIRWIQNILKGDFGYSIAKHTSIKEDIFTRIPNTIKLVVPSYATAFVLAIVLGLIAGSKKNKWQDKLIDGFASVGIAVPSFWFAMLLMYLFAYKLNWLPVLGMHTIGMEGNFADYMLHFIMPYIVLTVGFLPGLIRYVRSSTISQYKEDYVLVQKAFGSKPSEILFKHISKNILLPIITKLGMALPMLVTGAVITETIFSWPGIGPYFVKAIQTMDYPVVMDILVFSGSLVILGNLFADIACCIVDPRIKSMR